LILDEPTAGVDIGTKVEIYHLIRDLANAGAAILLISSSLPEILGMSDRIMVMSKGRITAKLNTGEATEEELVRAALGATVLAPT
jgi:ABC-type sugar transport system ATPase subunit